MKCYLRYTGAIVRAGGEEIQKGRERSKELIAVHMIVFFQGSWVGQRSSVVSPRDFYTAIRVNKRICISSRHAVLYTDREPSPEGEQRPT